MTITVFGHVILSVRNLLFLWVASTCYLVFKVVAKLTYLVAIIGGHVTARSPPIGIFMTKPQFHLVKGIISAFDIPAKFHDFSVMLTNFKDSHDLTIVF